MLGHPLYTADFSLALINRTGAYHICNDLLRELPHFFHDVRYWRLPFQPQPDLIRKLAGRAMLLEMSALGDSSLLARRRPDRPVLFMDPLYVLRTQLVRDDIVLCHDVGPISHPDLFEPETVRRYRMAYDKIARVGPGVVTVSDFSRTEYRKIYGDAARFLVVCRQYVRKTIEAPERSPVPGLDGPFLLTIGAMEKRKNHLRIIEAYARSGLYERGVEYVYAGARTPYGAEIARAASAVPGVRALGYVNEQNLRWLLRNATGMALPSLLEGFGLPPLEAAQQGLISIVSRGTVQEEALDGNAILVDPYDVDDIARGMKRLIDLPAGEKAALLAKAQAHAATLSFKRYIAGFEAVLSGNAAPNGLS
ncbi:MAG: glycosyltransferase [Alphaproteobacteria bacterium]|nr:glycosyltransferase [Alphaproteobacteria bacterium]